MCRKIRLVCLPQKGLSPISQSDDTREIFGNKAAKLLRLLNLRRVVNSVIVSAILIVTSVCCRVVYP